MTKVLETVDVAIIGAGPAGLFAVFQCGMLGMRVAVIDALDAIGGQCTALYPEKPIYDVPAHPSITGAQLIQQLETQAAPFHPNYHLGEQVDRVERTMDGRWRVSTSVGTEVDAAAVIIAAGVGAFGPNRPPLAGIEAFEGRSVFYYVRHRDAFAGKRIVIAGGGDSAVDWALSLVGIAERIMVVHRRARFRAAPEPAAQLERLARDGAIDLVTPYQLAALEGENGVLRAVMVETMEGETRRLPADALLAFFGLSMNLGPIAEWGLALDRNQIHVMASSCATNAPGIFAVGDIANYPGKLKLILNGFAEAAQAAHAIHRLVFPDQPLRFEHSTTKGVPTD